MKKKFRVLATLLVWLLSGCSSVSSEQVSPLTTPIITSNLVERPTQVFASQTPVPLSTSTSVLPTPTKISYGLLSFVKENGGCKLPCIFGLTPGNSSRTAVNALLGNLMNSHLSAEQRNNATIDTFANYGWEGASLSFVENKANIKVELASRSRDEEVDRLDFSAEALQSIDGGAKKIYGDPYYDELLTPFTLSNILETYGQPDQIIIRPSPDDEGHPSPPAQYTFDFVLFYPEQGFVVEYVSVRNEKGKNFIGCPTESYLTQLSTWNPDEGKSINEVIKYKYFTNLDSISKENISEYKQLQNVTPLNVTDFYNMFRVSNSSDCVGTPKESWPATNR